MTTKEHRHAPAAVIHVPHASVIIPPDVREQFVLTDEQITSEIRVMTDHLTDELFAVEHDVAASVKFPISRLVLDPERFESDAQESMAARGMGVVPGTTRLRTRHGWPRRYRLKHSGNEPGTMAAACTPWGEDPPTCERAHFMNCGGKVLPVMAGRQFGKSPEGFHDLAGNAAEWCLDRFGPYADTSAIGFGRARSFEAAPPSSILADQRVGQNASFAAEPPIRTRTHLRAVRRLGTLQPQPLLPPAFESFGSCQTLPLRPLRWSLAAVLKNDDEYFRR